MFSRNSLPLHTKLYSVVLLPQQLPFVQILDNDKILFVNDQGKAGSKNITFNFDRCIATYDCDHGSKSNHSAASSYEGQILTALLGYNSTILTYISQRISTNIGKEEILTQKSNEYFKEFFRELFRNLFSCMDKLRLEYKSKNQELSFDNIRLNIYEVIDNQIRDLLIDPKSKFHSNSVKVREIPETKYLEIDGLATLSVSNAEDIIKHFETALNNRVCLVFGSTCDLNGQANLENREYEIVGEIGNLIVEMKISQRISYLSDGIGADIDREIEFRLVNLSNIEVITSGLTQKCCKALMIPSLVINDTKKDRKSDKAFLDWSAIDWINPNEATHSNKLTTFNHQLKGLLKAMTTLTRVVHAKNNALKQSKAYYIPYRDALLTRYLKASLEGNNLLSMITIPMIENIDQCSRVLRLTAELGNLYKVIWMKEKVSFATLEKRLRADQQHEYESEQLEENVSRYEQLQRELQSNLAALRSQLNELANFELGLLQNHSSIRYEKLDDLSFAKESNQIDIDLESSLLSNNTDLNFDFKTADHEEFPIQSPSDSLTGIEESEIMMEKISIDSLSPSRKLIRRTPSGTVQKLRSSVAQNAIRPLSSPHKKLTALDLMQPASDRDVTLFSVSEKIQKYSSSKSNTNNSVSSGLVSTNKPINGRKTLTSIAINRAWIPSDRLMKAVIPPIKTNRSDNKTSESTTESALRHQEEINRIDSHQLSVTPAQQQEISTDNIKSTEIVVDFSVLQHKSNEISSEHTSDNKKTFLPHCIKSEQLTITNTNNTNNSDNTNNSNNSNDSNNSVSNNNHNSKYISDNNNCTNIDSIHKNNDQNVKDYENNDNITIDTNANTDINVTANTHAHANNGESSENNHNLLVISPRDSFNSPQSLSTKIIVNHQESTTSDLFLVTTSQDQANNLDSDIDSDIPNHSNMLTLSQSPSRKVKTTSKVQLEEDEDDGLTSLERTFLRNVASGRVRQVLENIHHGVNIHVKNTFERDAMQIAARNGSNEILDLLLEHGGNIESRGAGGESLFHLAAHNGHLRTLRWLLDHGADPEAVNAQGESVVHIAAARLEVEVLIFLREDLNMDILHRKDSRDRSPADCLPRRTFNIDDEERLLKCKEYFSLCRMELREQSERNLALETVNDDNN